ncbi:MAG: hypothetical protein IKO56_06310 [Alphaproteobacteria bacterium]|nr:hypothetical protein [Alphaproteobacteria bacterium]
MTESNKKSGFTEEQLEQFADNFRRGKITLVPKEALPVLGDYYTQLVEKAAQTTVTDMSDEDDIGGLSHALCHIYEDGLMSNELCRPIGDVLLDKLIEKAEQGYFSHANRSIDGYWRSVKDSPDAWKGLKAVLEKHPNYVFGQRYLSYMNGATPEDEMKVVQEYIKNPNMYFVTTPMVDIDGTLIQNGKANDDLIESIMNRRSYENFAIYTGGDPVAQKELLLKAIAERIAEKIPSIKEEFPIDTIISIYSQDNEQNIALREKLFSTIRNKASYFVIEHYKEFKKRTGTSVIEGVKYWAKNVLEFLSSLMAKSGNQIKIYPKRAFAQENICLAGTVIDDTQPTAQGIKSLTLAVLTPGEFSRRMEDALYDTMEKVPEERKITAEQAFGMYQQKRKTQMIAETEKLNKLEAAVEQESTTLSEVCNNSKNTTR